MSTPSLPSVVVLQRSQELQNLFDSYQTVIVKCGATWCGPCKALAPHYKKMAESYHKTFEGLALADLDIDNDEFDDFVTKHKIVNVPVTLCFRDGKPHGKLLGGNPQALKAFIESRINN
jgi:thioredoxin 1